MFDFRANASGIRRERQQISRPEEPSKLAVTHCLFVFPFELLTASEVFHPLKQAITIVSHAKVGVCRLRDFIMFFYVEPKAS